MKICEQKFAKYAQAQMSFYQRPLELSGFFRYLVIEILSSVSVFNIPCVAGADLQTPLSLID